MSSAYPLLGSLDPHQQRLGYLTALCTIATRDYASRDVIASRLKELLFKRVYRDDPLFNALLLNVPVDRKEMLLARARENAENPDTSPASILAPPERQQAWLTVNTFWINDERMPSSLGELVESKVFRIVDLARLVSILLPGFDLSETGFLVKHLVEQWSTSQRQPESRFNPLIPDLRPALPLLYLRLLLEADVLFPFILEELVHRHDRGIHMQTRGADGILLASVDRLLATVGTSLYPDEIPAVQNINAFRQAIASNQSTQENYLRPRLEMLVDLGYLNRSEAKASRKSEFVWHVSEATACLARELEPLRIRSQEREEFLDNSFFRVALRSRSEKCRGPRNSDELLLFFARALACVAREFGFTPGRTAALLACLLAAEEGCGIEIRQVFDAVYCPPKSDLGQYMHFSGGSRFDREFLIRVDDALEGILSQRLSPGGSP